MGSGAIRRQVLPVMAALMLLLSVSASAQTRPAAPGPFAAALETWAGRHGIKRAFVVVRRDGRVVERFALGRADPDKPVPLASLSKAITGACVATLVRGGKLAFDTPLATALAKFIARHGKPRDPRVADLTIAQLLTHRAGFATGDDADPASGRNLDRYLRTNSARAPPKPSLTAAVLRARLAREPGSAYAYGNAGYFLLGPIIAEASGRPYLDYCRDAVLEPVGAAGDFAPAWRVSASMGGWRMTAEDYLKFLDLFAAEDPRLGAAAKAWMRDPQGKSVPFDSAAWYGLGTFVRKAEGGADVWHWGSWDYTPEAGTKGTVRTSFVAYAKRFADGTAWFVYAEPRVEEGAPRAALIEVLSTARRSAEGADPRAAP
jgi:CubicO group peptidase (beta-lactamase class C family)